MSKKKQTPELLPEKKQQEDTDVLNVVGVNSKGYGIYPKMVAKDRRLSPEAKCIYGYFCSYAGAGSKAFPTLPTILYDLVMGENRYRKGFNLLKRYGYITLEKTRNKDGTWGRNIYTLCTEIPEVVEEEKPEDTPEQPENAPEQPENAPEQPDLQIEGVEQPDLQIRGLDEPCLESGGTNINSFKNNNNNNVMLCNVDKLKIENIKVLSECGLDPDDETGQSLLEIAKMTGALPDELRGAIETTRKYMATNDVENPLGLVCDLIVKRKKVNKAIASANPLPKRKSKKVDKLISQVTKDKFKDFAL